MLALVHDETFVHRDIIPFVSVSAFGVQTLSFFILTFVRSKVAVIVFLTFGVGFGGLAVSGASPSLLSL